MRNLLFFWLNTRSIRPKCYFLFNVRGIFFKSLKQIMIYMNWRFSIFLHFFILKSVIGQDKMPKERTCNCRSSKKMPSFFIWLIVKYNVVCRWPLQIPSALLCPLFIQSIVILVPLYYITKTM